MLFYEGGRGGNPGVSVLERRGGGGSGGREGRGRQEAARIRRLPVTPSDNPGFLPSMPGI